MNRKRWGQVSSSHETRSFYDDLMEGRRSRGSFGKETRFNADWVGGRSVVQRFFVEVVRPYLAPTDRVLDFGCGTGVFLALAAPLCGTITGVDISTKFVDACREMIDRRALTNAEARTVEPGELPFGEETFDVVMMVDVIHHLEEPGAVLEAVMRRLRPGGRLLIFEPNKLNPLIWLYHALDRNEWGLLRLGTPEAYRKMVSPLADLDSVTFNGIVIGPKSNVFPWISNLINRASLYPYLGWLNPKLFIVGRKPARAHHEGSSPAG
jgi:2-polyprenyl-3-methyl-5-hydroxy-6-metoxy-1,4-benzoquinol methylase